jgi:hypothetical protein
MTTVVGYGYKGIVWLQGLGMTTWGGLGYTGTRGLRPRSFISGNIFSYFRYSIFSVYVIRALLSYQSLIWLSRGDWAWLNLSIHVQRGLFPKT